MISNLESLLGDAGCGSLAVSEACFGSSFDRFAFRTEAGDAWYQ